MGRWSRRKKLLATASVALLALALTVTLVVVLERHHQDTTAPPGFMTIEDAGNARSVQELDRPLNRYLKSPVQCAPDGGTTLGPFLDGTVVRYERNHSTVTVGVAPPIYDDNKAISQARKRITIPQCKKQQVRKLDEFDDDTTIAFKAPSTQHNDNDNGNGIQLHNYRAYRQIQHKGGYDLLLFVWIETQGEHTPTTSELERLLETQTAIIQHSTTDYSYNPS